MEFRLVDAARHHLLVVIHLDARLVAYFIAKVVNQLTTQWTAIVLVRPFGDARTAKLVTAIQGERHILGST